MAESALRADSTLCPTLQNDDHCYYWSITKAFWAKAEKHCNYCKGHLASVTSEAKNKFILSEIKKQNTAMLWIGGSEKEEQGNWKWTDQSPWSFENWADNLTSQGGNCLCYNSTPTTTRWSPSKCDQKFKFVCSVKLCQSNVCLATTKNIKPLFTGQHAQPRSNTTATGRKGKHAAGASSPVVLGGVLLAALLLCLLVVVLRHQKKKKIAAAQKSTEDKNPVYGLYYFADGAQIDGGNSEVVDSNAGYDEIY